VAASRGEWTGDPYFLPGERTAKGVVLYAVPRVYRTPERDFPDDVWEQAKAGGVLTHMLPADITLYADAFSNLAALRSLSKPENELQADLSFLAFDGPLNSSDRGRALSLISRLDTLNKETLNRARLLVENADLLGGRLSSADEKLLFGTLDDQEEFRGTCVDRAAALRLISPLRRLPSIRTR